MQQEVSTRVHAVGGDNVGAGLVDFREVGHSLEQLHFGMENCLPRSYSLPRLLFPHYSSVCISALMVFELQIGKRT